MTIQIGSAFLHLDPYGRVAAVQTETGDSLLPEKMEPQPFVQLYSLGILSDYYRQQPKCVL